MRYSGTGKAIFCILWMVLIGQMGRAENLPPADCISLDEVRPDMDAYCLTVFSGSKVEKFPLKVLSVVRNQRPGQDMILVLGTDERFNQAGAVHGCSGSPVYIDGRLAGALAAGWDGSLDSLYLVRPIKDMLEVGTAQGTKVSASTTAAFDFSQPLDLEVYYRQYMERLQERRTDNDLLLPLSTSLPAEVCQQYSTVLRRIGLMPAAAGPTVLTATAEDAGNFEPGSVLAVVLCGGDISLSGIGTATAIVGDQIYGFGHSLNGLGPVNLPIAAGVVHTVVASRSYSFKLSSPGPILGTLEFDQNCAVRGTIGKIPRTIPLQIEVSRFNDPRQRVYNCFLADDRGMTPSILQVVLSGAAQMQGPLPSEHTVRYAGQIVLEDGQPLLIDNVSSGRQLSDVVSDAASAVDLLMNNPFGPVPIRSINARIEIDPVSIAASIWKVNVSNARVRPGQTITAEVTLRSFRAPEKTAAIELKVPETLDAGKYKIHIFGAAGYQAFVSKAAPYKFRAYDLPTLKTGLEGLFKYRRDRLYAVMPIPATGLVIRQHELGQLPPTKVLLMQDAKRLQPLEPYNAWAEGSTSLDAVVDGTAEIEITVEK
ncbi:MAG TPA: SpoIVB peptidase S55 domain-containing protein [Anaerohalosphaeraceae bacterium]|nr:SpoIVB peptidase S55 domain-containing protein [Anaerohalosphaeraceae bacterium]HOM75787.1 SpoIVB peptidase S55 domain-containing protein [Anaerohalosphaeraceae bacterium]HPC64539.1 SpoIVB peptidase S55 domain-containing protein [Anaerohalosphaeraceae bacterium]HPO69176.1 SpoIVB peptidase S55 domain-containing protein [Anaerohalosphaeraceae bacterium]HRS70449.1 SpoIVB peptidase S55 domain-containing protein [Anaerohalosphaeraceae bacterium]